jgi:hypothetical protein
VSQNLGADELRVRSILKQRGVGPDAEPPTAPPSEPARRRRALSLHLAPTAYTITLIAIAATYITAVWSH